MYTEKIQVTRGIFHGIPLESVASLVCIHLYCAVIPQFIVSIYYPSIFWSALRHIFGFFCLLGVSRCCGRHCCLAIVLWSGYSFFSVSFALRHLVIATPRNVLSVRFVSSDHAVVKRC